LPGELLSELQPLSWRERHVHRSELLGLLTVDPGPLGLVTGLEQCRPAQAGHGSYGTEAQVALLPPFHGTEPESTLVLDSSS
jgi:hypothetical protein